MIGDLKPYTVRKDSGVEWLGQIPSHWTEKRAKYFYREVDERSTTGEEELLSVSHKTGVTPRKQSVTMFMAESNVGYKLCRPNDVAANTMWVFMGALGVSKQVGLVSPSYGVYRPIRPGELLPEYVDRLLRVDGYKAEYMCRSTGINSSRLRLYPDDFLRIPIVCPPISEQAVIVRYLDHVDRRVRRLVRAKRKLIALLTEQKQAIIHRAVTRGLDPDVPLKDSGVECLGEVPAHWEILRIKQTARVLRGKFTHRPRNDPALYDGPYPFIQTGDVARAEKSVQTYAQTLNDRGLTVSKMFPRGTLLMTIAANIGDVAVLDFEACFPDSVVGFLPRQNVERDFLYYTFRAMRAELLREAPVNTQGNLNVDRIGSRELALPPSEEQAKIVSEIESVTASIENAISRASREIHLLSEYRTRLTADVVTGKLDVREAAAVMPEVDPLAAEDEPDTLDAESDSDLDGLDTLTMEAEA